MNPIQPYQIDFQGRWTVVQRCVVTDAIMRVELHKPTGAPVRSEPSVRWICQAHDDPIPLFIAHYLRRSEVLYAPTAEALAEIICELSEDPETKGR